jgi:hypothetical protein
MRPVEQSRTRWCSLLLGDIKKKVKTWKTSRKEGSHGNKLRRRDNGNIEDTGDCIRQAVYNGDDHRRSAVLSVRHRKTLP